jgi:hypothetical protein
MEQRPTTAPYTRIYELQRELAEAVALLRSWPKAHKYGVCPSCGVSLTLQSQTRAFLAKYPEEVKP